MATVQDVIDLARRAVNDDGKVRYTDADGLKYFRTAFDEYRRRRPDLFIATLGKPAPALELSTAIDLDPMHHQVLADAVAARWLLREDEVQGEGTKAQSLFTLAART